MQRNSRYALALVCAAMMSACAGSPGSQISPTAASPVAATLNPDGSSLKVTAPRDLGPNGVVVTTLRPTLSFTNPIGKYASAGYAYDIEIMNASGAVVYPRTIGESAGSSSHTLDADLSYATNYQWRARARIGTDVGPWSGLATFRTLDPPPPPPPPGPPPVPPSILPPGDPGSWSYEQWQFVVYNVIFPRHGIPSNCCVNDAALYETDADLRQLGAFWQFTSAGLLRPRIFLPGGSNPFARTVDVGNNGGSWAWIIRGQT